MPTKEEVHQAALVLSAARRDQEGITRSKKSKNPQESPKKEEPKKSKVGWIIGFASAALLVGIGVGVYFLVASNRGPDLSKATIQYEESNGGYKVTGIGNENKSLVKTIKIPNTYNGKPVNEIKAGALGGCANLEEVTLPFIGRNANAKDKEGLFGYVFGKEMSEGAGAYTWQQYMDEETGEMQYEQAIIPDSLYKVSITGGNKIAPGAFSYCKYISEINIDNDATVIGNYSFYYCSSLYEFNIKNNITEVDDYAFSRNYVLQEVNLPKGLTTIGEQAFSNDISVSLVYVPDTVTTIEHNAFMNLQSSLIVCEATEKQPGWADDWVSEGVSVSFGTQNIVYAENCLVSICNDGSESNGEYIYLIQWTGEWETATLNIPDTLTINGSTYPVKVIGTRFFEDNNNVHTVNLGKNITKIGAYAFSDCDKLTTFNFSKDFNINDSKTENKTLTYIGAYCFANCPNLKGYTRNDVFFDGVVLPNNITELGDHAFYNCNHMSHLRIPEHVVTIGDSCFEGCERLMWGFHEHHMINGAKVEVDYCPEAIRIPRSITKLGKAAFKNCFRLQDDGETSILHPMIYVEDGSEDPTDPSLCCKLDEYDDSVFENCGIYTKTGIYSRQIRINFDLGTVQDPGVRRFGDSCFKNAYMYNFVVRNEELSEVGDYAFYNCYPNFPNNAVKICHNVKSIGDYAFYNWNTCAGVYFEGTTEQDIEDEKYPHLETIGKYAFYGMNNAGFNDLVIPCTVKTIGEYAFYNCNKVETLTFQEPKEWEDEDGVKREHKFSVKTIEPYTFASMTSLGRTGSPLRIPDSVETLERYSFQNCRSVQDIQVACDEKGEKPAATIKKVSWNVFYGCQNLKTIEWNLSNCESFSSSVFYNCYNLVTDATATLGAKYNVINSSTYANCTSLKSITINKNIKYVNSSAFVGCTNLEKVTFQNSGGEGQYNTCYFNSYAFKDCKNLKELDLHSNFTSLAEQSLAGCTSLGDPTKNSEFHLSKYPNFKLTGNNVFMDWTEKQTINFYDANVKGRGPDDSVIYLFGSASSTNHVKLTKVEGQEYYTTESPKVGSSKVHFVYAGK